MEDLINGFFKWILLDGYYWATGNQDMLDGTNLPIQVKLGSGECCVLSGSVPCFFVGDGYIDFAINKTENGECSYIGRERYKQTDDVLGELVKIIFQQELENYLESVGCEVEENRMFKPPKTTESQLKEMLGGREC